MHTLNGIRIGDPYDRKVKNRAPFRTAPPLQSVSVACVITVFIQKKWIKD
jgi:hypothetical protein